MAEEALDVKACVERVKQGSEAAAVALMEHLYPLVIRLVRSYRVRRIQEEDLTQMVFLKIFTRLETYSGKAPLEHWVSRVTVNTCLNQIKAEKVRPELRWADMSEEECHVIETLHRTQADLHPSKSLAAREVVELLVSRLNPKDRLLIQLMYLEERTVKEVQQVTGWSEPVIKVRAFRARQKLRKLWRQIEFEEKHESYRPSAGMSVKGSLASA
ncbi:MAG: ECF RNA polymerase sigma-E factor [Verrucomicrobia subdivision 3 bacterium]|nr:ECF RNA polymerase sigma-E factor [Limisphaerales bacterium]MCS1413054.1 ECF RNA polymerase sigma-E factor [Limisphaerales bacterium]